MCTRAGAREWCWRWTAARGPPSQQPRCRVLCAAVPATTGVPVSRARALLQAPTCSAAAPCSAGLRLPSWAVHGHLESLQRCDPRLWGSAAPTPTASLRPSQMHVAATGPIWRGQPLGGSPGCTPPTCVKSCDTTPWKRSMTSGLGGGGPWHTIGGCGSLDLGENLWRGGACSGRLSGRCCRGVAALPGRSSAVALWPRSGLVDSPALRRRRPQLGLRRPAPSPRRREGQIRAQCGQGDDRAARRAAPGCHATAQGAPSTLPMPRAPRRLRLQLPLRRAGRHASRELRLHADGRHRGRCCGLALRGSRIGGVEDANKSTCSTPASLISPPPRTAARPSAPRRPSGAARKPASQIIGVLHPAPSPEAPGPSHHGHAPQAPA
jgi:hypothetical protein